jgi:integrase/recombinase XerC
VELLYTLGVRRSELIGIRDRDLDINARTVKIYGKGGKERLLPLLSSTVGLIKEYVDKRTIKFKAASFSSLLVTDKGQVLYPKFVYRKINDYLKSVSVKQKKSPHMIRHTFATHLLNRGADLNTVKELLGHSSLAATQVYTHSSIEELKMIYQSSHPRGNQSSS